MWINQFFFFDNREKKEEFLAKKETYEMMNGIWIELDDKIELLLCYIESVVNKIKAVKSVKRRERERNKTFQFTNR